MSEYAPVVVFVYNRADDAKLTLEKLDKNTLAGRSKLFIFSDGAKNETGQDRVSEVRKYIHEYSKISAFESVDIIEADENKGLANSVIGGVTKIINEFGKVIVVEDDLITSEDFLEYMNGGLDFYMDSPEIWSISGYTHALPSLKDYTHDVYLGYRASSWGWATWKDRWEKVDWKVSDYDQFRFSIKKRRQFARGGMDLPSMLKAQMNGKIDSWAVRWCYAQSMLDMYTVFPKVSRVKNIGLDGTGTHGKADDADTYLSNFSEDASELKFEEAELNMNLVKESYSVFYLSLYIRIRDKIRELKDVIN